ncbi:hypothetical protein ACOSP7_007176 [Xanthoceras sorbifolium]|uniref:Pectinesterase inhibitor domain-containing protein n=1 Tax=Xanthoceras sorbifolium TaxID=99658 RepID=A0ABQ8IA07_9ROSI|nr:hypothetical protein JRO89_XS03G0156400 [Xanthoceras sorbifolium]
MEPKTNNQILIVFSFLSLTLFNRVTQAICVPANSTYTSLSSAPSPQQQPAFLPSPPPQIHISALTTATNLPKTDISTDTPTMNQPKSDILGPTDAATNPPKTDIPTPTPTSNPPKADISSPNQAPDPSQGGSRIFLPDPSPNNSPLPPHAEIKHICELTDFPTLCWPYISAFYSGKSDATSVLEMAINATAQQIKLAHSAITNFASNPNLPSNKVAMLLDDCKEMYDDALDNLKSAMDAIPQRDISTVNIMLSAALTDFTTCDDEFTEEDSPVGDIDNKLNKLLSNCLAIASLIKM